MLDFTPVREQQITWLEFVKDLTIADLIALSKELSDTQLHLIEDCTDADVVFVPLDKEAHDPYAENPDDEDLAWTLGHVVVHSTASSEEYAFLSAEMARGVPYEQRRSRYETPWETVTTMTQCRARIEESRRMVLGMLSAWPDQPDLENRYTSPRGTEVNCFVRFVFGMAHAEEHLSQIEEIVRQAKAARA